MDDNEKDDPKAEKEWYVIVLGWIETVEPRAELWSLEAHVRPCDPLVRHRPASHLVAYCRCTVGLELQGGWWRNNPTQSNTRWFVTRPCHLTAQGPCGKIDINLQCLHNF